MSSTAVLPHQYPFRLVDRRAGERAVIALSAGAVWGQGVSPYPTTLLIEMMAQAAMVLLDGPESPSKAYLAGVEDLVVVNLPEPGQRLLASAQLQVRFGGTIKISARLAFEEKEIAAAVLLLVAAPDAP